MRRTGRHTGNPAYLRGQDGEIRERLRQFFAVWLETDSAEDALWVVLHEDRRQRCASPRLGDGRAYRKDDPVIGEIVKAAAQAAKLSMDALLAGVTVPEQRARGVAIRALRDEGYSVRAISRALSGWRSRSAVQQALGRIAACRELVEAAVRVRRRAHRAARRAA